MDCKKLPTWKQCRLIIDNYEYSTTKGATGIETITPPTEIEMFIYENEPVDKKESLRFRQSVVDVLNSDSDVKLLQEIVRMRHQMEGE